MTLTQQEIFDKVVAHANEQRCLSHGKVRKLNEPYCLYRGPNNTKCFAGIFITDEEYKPDMESRGLKGVQATYNLSVFKEFDLFRDLQNVHDKGESQGEYNSETSTNDNATGQQLLEIWNKAFALVAKKYSLDFETMRWDDV